MRQKLTFALGTALLVAAMHPSGLAAQECIRRELTIKPQWISTVEYNSPTDQVFIADPKALKLLAFDAKKRVVSEVTLPGNVQPASITRIEGGFVVNYRDDAFILAPPEKRRPATAMKALATANLRHTETGASTGLVALYTNWTTRGSSFLGFGSVTRAPIDVARPGHDPSRGYQLGIVRGTISTHSRQFLNVELVEATEQNDLYLLGLPYFAATNDELFFVRMVVGERASLVKVEGAPGRAVLSRLDVIPQGFTTVPTLKGADLGPNKTSDRFKHIEKQTMVAGLFGQGKFLYLLARRPSGAGTEWLLFQIDPGKPEVTAELRLPTHANHLTVATDSTHWYFFERGEVRAWGDQDINNVLMIPKKWIADPTTSPLGAASDGEPSCRYSAVRR